MRRARPLTEAEWEERATPAGDEAFASFDPFNAPFNASIADRALLFPISYELEPAQIEALGRAAQAVGDETLFLLILWVAKGDKCYWEIPPEDPDPYRAIAPAAPNAIFSPSGAWGLLISEDDHAVIGGSAEFMQLIADTFPPSEDASGHFVLEGPLDRDAPAAPLEERLDRILSASREIPLQTGAPFGDGQVIAFLEFWSDPSNYVPDHEWLPALLVHLYGELHAHRLLRGTAWSR